MKTIIIDDEKHCREVLQLLLEKHCPEVQVLASFSSGTEALERLPHLRPDLVFLDIEMPGMNGFEFLDAVSNKQFALIFTTAYNEYAIRAIRHSALDYLLKPVDREELKQAVSRAQQQHQSNAADLPGKMARLLDALQPTPGAARRIALPTAEGLLMADATDIAYLESEGPYCHVHFIDKRHLLISKTLKDVEEVLPPERFFRIHHSFVVNLHCVAKYLRGEGGEVMMTTGQTIPVSRQRKQEFLSLLARV